MTYQKIHRDLPDAGKYENFHRHKLINKPCRDMRTSASTSGINKISYENDTSSIKNNPYKSLPRSTLTSGPLRGDHTIGVRNHNPKLGSSYKPLRKLDGRKSQSLTNLSYDANNSIDESLKQTMASYQEERIKLGFNITRCSSQSDLRINGLENFAKRTETLFHNAKFKLSELSGGVQSTSSNAKYSSSTDDPIMRIRKKFYPQMEDEVHVKDSKKGTYSKEYSKLNRKTSLDISVPPILSNRKESHGNSFVNKTVRRHSFSGSKTSLVLSSGLSGLQNLGNTCFMNSILQCLCKTKQLRDYFCRANYDEDLNEIHAPTKGQLAKAFAKLMNNMWSRDSSFIVPSLVKSEVQKYAKRFSGSNQQDAQEFLRFFIEGVHDDLNLIRRKPNLNILDDSHMSDEEKSNVYWERYLSRERSVIQGLFVGQLESILTCSVCGHRSVTYDPFWDLSLPIPRSKDDVIDIRLCFQVFTQEEILDGDEKPTCEKCKKRRKCTKRFLIKRFPKILVLHLKRFSGQRYRTKLNHRVNFPFELPLDEFAASDLIHGTTYSLYAVSNHMGSTYGGHYTAYCKHPDSKKWHVYNDLRVNEVAASKVVSTSAYVLFYQLTT